MPHSDALTQLAMDLSWSWSHSADEIWKRLDPELWELTANPCLILLSISKRKLESLPDAAFHERVEQLQIGHPAINPCSIVEGVPHEH